VKRIGPFSIEGALILVGCVVLLLGVQNCHAARDGFRRARIAQLEAQGYAAARASIRARRTTDSLTRRTLEIERKVIVQASRLTTLGWQLDAVLAVNDSILSLPPDSAGEGVLRYQLAKTSEVARLYRDSTDVLLGSIDAHFAAVAIERQGWLAEREAHIKELAAKDRLIATLRESEQVCRIAFLPCPNRVQSVAIGAGSILLLLLL
jgi:hypothetical protein